MARSKTLLQLRTLARQKADAETSTHVGDAELTGYVNDSIAALHARIVEVDEGAFEAESILSVAAGTVSSEIVSGEKDPYKILAVDVINADGLLSYAVRRFSLGERAALGEINSLPWPGTTCYRLRGFDANTLLWAPPFGVDTTVRVTYVESFANLVADSDAFDGRDGWDEWVAWDSAIKILVKEESSIADAEKERDRVWARILPQFNNVDRAEPDRVRDVTQERDAQLWRRW